jgi:HSP20 family protein
MALLNPNTSWTQSGDDYELYEKNGEFVLSVEMPGFDGEGIAAEYTNGILEVRLPSAEGATARGKAIEVQS